MELERTPRKQIFDLFGTDTARLRVGGVEPEVEEEG